LFFVAATMMLELAALPRAEKAGKVGPFPAFENTASGAAALEQCQPVHGSAVCYVGSALPTDSR
jgi:hypothetical protein